MEQIGISSYLSGVTNMASACSTEIGPSFIEAISFDLKDYKKEFAKFYKIPESEMNLITSELSLKDILRAWIGKNNERIVDNVLYLTERIVGEPNSIYTIDESSKIKEYLGRESGGISEFYFVEDIIFVEFNESMVSFIIGNNE